MISFLKLITLLGILKLTFLLTAAECDLTKCGLPKHYREIGTCEPTKYAPDDIEKCCPIEYNCDKIAQQNSAQCHFRNQTYSNGQQLDVYVHCRPSCYCNNNGQFNCAQVSCPETTFDRPEPNCVVQNTRDQCCSTSIICDPQAIEKLHVCHMDGKEYRQGQKMFPKSNRCFTCYCDETFNNATEISQNPACLEVDCAIELAYLPRIRSGCVPVYFGEPTCCPISSKCRKCRRLLIVYEFLLTLFCF